MDYVIATIKSWNISMFNKLKLGDNWKLITSPKEYDVIRQLKPRYVFFIHWSWMIPNDVYENNECIIFHMTDLPFGRGAEPLQHLISLGYKDTVVSAIKCEGEIDSGDIYLKKPMSLLGSAEEIYIRCSNIVFDMIKEIIKNNLKAEKKQIGQPTYFTKRVIKDCEIPDTGNLLQVYDWIRMQDAETYPPAFINTNKLHLEFNRAALRNGYIEANVKINVRELNASIA